MNGVLTVKPVYLWPLTLTSSLLAYVIILDISTPPPLVILSFAFIPAGSGGPKRGQTLARNYYSICTRKINPYKNANALLSGTGPHINIGELFLIILRLNCIHFLVVGISQIIRCLDTLDRSFFIDISIQEFCHFHVDLLPFSPFGLEILQITIYHMEASLSDFYCALPMGFLCVLDWIKHLSK